MLSNQISKMVTRKHKQVREESAHSVCSRETRARLILPWHTQREVLHKAKSVLTQFRFQTKQPLHLSRMANHLFCIDALTIFQSAAAAT
jgi:hypothetical protein